MENYIRGLNDYQQYIEEKYGMLLDEYQSIIMSKTGMDENSSDNERYMMQSLS